MINENPITPAMLAAMLPTDVRSVYSGKAHACCCGCSGIHRYNSLHMTEASKDRGYAVTVDDVNDAFVKRVLKTVQTHVATAEFGEVYVSVDIGERMYTIYPINEKLVGGGPAWANRPALPAVPTLA